MPEFNDKTVHSGPKSEFQMETVLLSENACVTRMRARVPHPATKRDLSTSSIILCKAIHLHLSSLAL